jgi:hypothetical protein
VNIGLHPAGLCGIQRSWSSRFVLSLRIQALQAAPQAATEAEVLCCLLLAVTLLPGLLPLQTDHDAGRPAGTLGCLHMPENKLRFKA